ncbi:PIN domain-containing protein [Patescibacteria group bacterium]|nr:PIN domain-containing protein [Patescibacteria group bacterium]
MEVFLDANIFFAGARSQKGGSGFILELAKRQKIEITTVSYVLLEAEQNF